MKPGQWRGGEKRGEEIVTARARGRDRLLLEAFSVQWLVDWLLIVEH